MKSFICLPLACLAGIVIGAWGPRERLRTSLDNARKRAQEEARWGASRAVTANGFHAFAWLGMALGISHLTRSGSRATAIDLLGRGPFDAAVHAGRFAILPELSPARFSSGRA